MTIDNSNLSWQDASENNSNPGQQGDAGSPDRAGVVALSTSPSVFFSKLCSRIGITVYEAADDIGLNPLYLESVELGSTTQIPREILDSIAARFGVKRKDLLNNGFTELPADDVDAYTFALKCAGMQHSR